MNMKKNGFTLLELIVTISLVAVVGVVISANVLGMFSDQEDQDYEEFVKKIEESACMYVETSFDSTKRSNCKRNGCMVTIDDIISKGYIADDLVDPSTGEKVINNKNKYKVNVTWPNDVKTCKMVGR